MLTPALCIFWFMAAAMRNERFAARQKLADVHRGRLSSVQARLQHYWENTMTEVERLAESGSPSSAFAKCVQSGAVDSVIIFDEAGRILYPNAPFPLKTASVTLEPKWTKAGQLEYLRKDFIAAANHYKALAKDAVDARLTARALQGEARCLVQAGKRNDAIQLVNEILADGCYDQATDPQGRLIAANADLMVLELMTNHASLVFQATAQRLAKRLTDYENPALAASQRLFLMEELQKLCPKIAFPTLAAEELAAEVCARISILDNTGDLNGPAEDAAAEMGIVSPRSLNAALVNRKSPALPVVRASRPGLWQFVSSDRRVLALVRSENLLVKMQTVLAGESLPPDTEIALVPPGVEKEPAFVSLPAGPRLPGWRLVLGFKDQNVFTTTMEHRTTLYLWTGVLVVAAVGGTTILAIRLLRRQMMLARLKNDLAATVSHELKTPLSAMRVFVDTLLDSEQMDEKRVREYLHLIAQENERLSRVIQNFLTFSRIEREKQTFHFTLASPRQIIARAIETVGKWLDSSGCRLEVEVEADLPSVLADPDAIVTALINLLENACKYSEEIKHIILSVRVESANVIFSVKDHGIGIAPSDAKKIFQPFYQVDRRLSRRGSGCGLGLSIVQSIVIAHKGSVSVKSQSDQGSTFAISLPAAPGDTHVSEEARG